MFLPPANNRITRYERVLLASVVLLSTLVTAVVIVADQLQVGLLADFMRARSGSRAACNATLGARFLFWTAFVYEFASIVMALHLKSRPLDVVAYQARMKSGKGDQQEQKLGLIPLIIFAAITYWGSFYLAYGDSTICKVQYFVPVVVGYAHVFGVSVARGLLTFFFCHLYFMSLDTTPDRKSTE